MKIPTKLLKDILSDPYYKTCARFDEECGGRITLEHALLYAGRQVQEKFAIIPLCEFHHGVGKYQNEYGLNKQENIRIAVSRATKEDLTKFPRQTWNTRL